MMRRSLRKLRRGRIPVRLTRIVCFAFLFGIHIKDGCSEICGATAAVSAECCALAVRFWARRKILAAGFGHFASGMPASPAIFGRRAERSGGVGR